MQNNNNNLQNFTGQLNRTYPQQRAADPQYDNRTARSDPSYMQPEYSEQSQQYKQQVYTNSYDPNDNLVSSNTTGYYDNNPSYPGYQQQSPYPASYDLISPNLNGSYQQRNLTVNSNQHPVSSSVPNSAAVVQSSGRLCTTGSNDGTYSQGGGSYAAGSSPHAYSKGGTNYGRMDQPQLYSTPNNKMCGGHVPIQNIHAPYIKSQKRQNRTGGNPVITDEELLKLKTPELNKRLRFYR